MRLKFSSRALEAEIMSDLDYPLVSQLLGCAQSGSALYVAMEYCPAAPY
jgi:hypothetical protein